MAEYIVSNPAAEILEQSESRGPAFLDYSSGYWSSPERGFRAKGAPFVASVTGSPQTSASAVGASAVLAAGAPLARVQIRYENTEGIEAPAVRRLPRPLRKAVQRLRRLEPSVRQHLLAADVCLHMRKDKESIPHLEAGLLGCGQFPELQSLIWMLLGMAHVAVGHFKEASVCHLHHLAFCRELEDFPSITKAECNLGIAYTKLGLLKLAGRCFLQYLENSQRLQDRISVANALSNLGLLSKILALHSYQASVKDGQKAHAKEILHVHLRRAITYLEQHLELVEEMGDLEKQGRTYGNLGWCYQTLKQYPQAVFCHNKRLEVARTTGDRKVESCTLCNLGNCFRATGKLHEAADYYLLNLEMSHAMGNKKGETVSLLNLGSTCELLDQLDKAIEWYTLYLSAMVDQGDVHGQARAFSALAGIYEEIGQMTKAEDYYRKLAAVFHQLGDRESQNIAAVFAQQMKTSVHHEKQLSLKESQKTLRRYQENPRRRKTRTVSSANTFRLEPPKKRSLMTSQKMGTWGRNSRLPWYYTPSASPCPQPPLAASGGQRREAVEVEGEVLENQGASDVCVSQEYLTLATQPQQHSTAMATRDLLGQDAVGGGGSPCRPNSSQQQQQQELATPFYRLSRIITEEDRPLPSPPPSDTGSITSFESAQDLPGFHHMIAGSRRHITELQRVGADLSLPVNELGLAGTDKEWEQWLRIQESTDDSMLSRVGSLNMDLSLFCRGRDGGRGGGRGEVSGALPHHSTSAPDITEQPNPLEGTREEVHYQ